MLTKILVIDDDPAITDLLSSLLTTQGYDVITSNTGQGGINLARDVRPHVILLDLMMPDKDGWEVCKTIRTFSTAAIMVLSALDDPRIVATLLDSGADDYLVKPIPSNVLLAHLKKIVRRTGSLESPPTSFTAMERSTPIHP